MFLGFVFNESLLEYRELASLWFLEGESFLAWGVDSAITLSLELSSLRFSIKLLTTTGTYNILGSIIASFDLLTNIYIWVKLCLFRLFSSVSILLDYDYLWSMKTSSSSCSLLTSITSQMLWMYFFSLFISNFLCFYFCFSSFLDNFMRIYFSLCIGFTYFLTILIEAIEVESDRSSLLTITYLFGLDSSFNVSLQ